MSVYTPLFTLTVEHGFYDDGLIPGLRFVATDRTAQIIHNCALLIKPVAGGIVVLQDRNSSEALSLYAASDEEPLYLVFKAHAADAVFKSRSDVSIAAHDTIPLFDNRNTEPTSDGPVRLHDGEHVSMIDLASVDDNRVTDILDHRERGFSPLFIVNIQINTEHLAAVGGDSNMPPINYYIRFKERQLFWKYYLVGGMARESLFLVDADSQAEFILSGKELLEDRREAITFRSTRRLPLKASAHYRFQLKERDNGSEKVIIKRLPMADVARLGRAVIDGRSEVVSEIYINC